MYEITLTSNQLKLLTDLEAQLLKPLPGRKAQNRLSPVIDNAKYSNAPDDHRVACVMALIYPLDGALQMIFIERASSHPDDKHAGQIGFPGGKMEDDDKSYLECALREVEEEIGIGTNEIKVLAPLTDLYVFASNFMVYPFVGYLDHIPDFVPQESEVASIISFPLDSLLDEGTLDVKDLTVRGQQIKNVPYYKLERHTLWGATAMITSELLEVIKASRTS